MNSGIMFDRRIGCIYLACATVAPVPFTHVMCNVASRPVGLRLEGSGVPAVRCGYRLQAAAEAPTLLKVLAGNPDLSRRVLTPEVSSLHSNRILLYLFPVQLTAPTTLPQSLMAPSATRYTLCTTYEDAALAAYELSQDPTSTVILDCEGCNFGMIDGALSIIAIGNSTASRIFLFDALALSDKDDARLAPLLSLLRTSDVTKIVWDGRADFYEIAEAYGVLLGGVLDLQIAEVRQRSHQKSKKKSNLRYLHTYNYFKRCHAELEQNPSALDGIYRLYGLGHCANLFVVLDENGGKNAVVSALHKKNGTEMWMQRPLPDVLLQYSAHDIEMIARMYERFKKKSSYLRDPDTLKEMSARYMRAYPTRELKALHAQLDITKFLPLDVLEAPPEQARRYRCLRCERMLSLSCFATAAAGTGRGTEQRDDRSSDGSSGDDGRARRFTVCHLCYLLARRNTESMLGEWIPMIE
ncbi:hypothetical protein C8Q80DRAFT_486532 [Daedaleopsis nitida]|nr:hypothetical protein C8Q80DRAFT_486532 [Daedaleopsis nitida]